MTEKKEKPKYEYIHGMWTSTEQVTEKDNYMAQIDSVQAMSMRPSWSDSDYDNDGMQRALAAATCDELSMYSRKTKDKIDKQYKKYADEVSTTN